MNGGRIGWKDALIVCGVIAGLAMLAVGAHMLDDLLWERAEVRRLNALHEADALRIVELEGDLQAAYRRLAVARTEKGVLENVAEALRKDLKRQGLVARANYDMAVSYRDQLVAVTQAQIVGEDTEIPIEMREGRMWVDLLMRLRGHHVPATVSIDVEGEAGIDSLPISLVVAEETSTGGLVAQLSSSDPHVGVVYLEGITDLRSTGAERKRRSLFGFESFTAGAAAGAGAVGAVWVIVDVVLPTLFGGGD